MSLGIDVFGDAEPVIRHRRGATTEDAAGDQRRGPWTAAPLEGCSIVPGTATEDTLTGFAQVDKTATLYGPADLDLLESDEVGWRGKRWQVIGQPPAWGDALGIGIDTAVIELRRREG